MKMRTSHVLLAFCKNSISGFTEQEGSQVKQKEGFNWGNVPVYCKEYRHGTREEAAKSSRISRLLLSCTCED
ncbi:hypothetical protein K1719_042698 [Acacia pycnantha]|nr:hypothetical protein K1719_042698 [Acacia pycnantha]